MKKPLLILCFLAFTTTITLGMDVDWQFIGGLNYSNVRYSEDQGVNPRDRLGFQAGVGLTQVLDDQISLDIGLMLSQKGYSLQETATQLESEVKMTGGLELLYLTVPAVANYEVANGFQLFGGVEAGLLLESVNRVQTAINGTTAMTVEQNVKANTADIDYGLLFGAAYTVDQMTVEIMYNFGLADINQDSEGGTGNNVGFSVIAGYLFE